LRQAKRKSLIGIHFVPKSYPSLTDGNWDLLQYGSVNQVLFDWRGVMDSLGFRGLIPSLNIPDIMSGKYLQAALSNLFFPLFLIGDTYFRTNTVSTF
jgi:hypothetical protein